MEGSKLWHTVLPVQCFAVVLSLGYAILAGIQEKARGAGVKVLPSKLIELPPDAIPSVMRCQCLVCLELLVPVSVIRHFHWTCSILKMRNI